MYPVLFKIGNIEVQSYYVLWSVALTAAMLWANKRIDRSGLPVAESTFVVTWSFVAMLVGASVFDFERGGLSEVGAVISAVIVAYFLCRAKKISFWKFADALSPAVLLAISIGRWGCFLNGCCTGVGNFPIQLDYAFSALTVLAIVLTLENRFEGLRLAAPVGMGLYSAARLIIDPFRVEAATGGMLSTKYALVAILILSIAWAFASWRGHKISTKHC